MDIKKILVTGFAPFDGAEINPSFEAVKLLMRKTEISEMVVCRQLPVAFLEAPDILMSEIKLIHPVAVICVGLAAGRTAITPEVIAVNLRNARIPDNNGCQPVWERIIEDGPDGIFSRLPVRSMVSRLKESGIPAELSYSAGTYVCNEVMYRVLHDFDGPAGFIHVPASIELGGKMTLEEMAEGLSICVRTVI